MKEKRDKSDERRQKPDRRLATRDEFSGTDRRIGSRREDEQSIVE